MIKKTLVLLSYCLLAGSALFGDCCPKDKPCYHALEGVLDEVRSGVINPYRDLELFIERAREASALVPDEVKKELQNLKDNKVKCGYVILDGLPLDEPLIDTPGREIPTYKNSYVSEFCLSLFGTLIGEPFNYIQEEKGNIFRNVRPMQLNEAEQTSDSSKVLLELHTETAFHPFKPDFLMLHCLRGDRNKEAFTLVSSLKEVIPLLDEETLAELRRPQYLTGIDVSFGNKDKTKYREELIPVLYGEGDDEMITYDLDLMVGLTEPAKAALQTLTEAILKVQKGVLLQPGQLLIFDNKRIIHGRTAFHAYYDGKDRWLQRVYLSVDPLFKHQLKNNGRIVTTQF